MYTFIIILTIIAALFLILVVLAQNSKGGGLSSQFGGSGSSQLMGVKKTSDLLEKITWGLAIAILVFSLTSSFMIDTTTDEAGFSSPNVEKARDRTVFPGMEEGEGVPLDTAATNGVPLEQQLEGDNNE